jgi:hypothetical protein
MMGQNAAQFFYVSQTIKNNTVFLQQLEENNRLNKLEVFGMEGNV